MNTAQRWWRGLDHYYWLTAFLAARGVQQTTCRLVALVILGMSAISLTMIWSPTGPQGRMNQILAVVVAVCCWGLAAIWLRGRWPTVIESRFCVCAGAVCIAVSCLIQSDALSGLFGATAFTLVAIYAAVFHTTRWLGITWAATGVTLAVLAVRLAPFSIAFAISSVLLVGFIVMFVSLTGRAAIWLVDADILHENFEPLTGMFNRDGFYEKATTLLASRSRGDDRFVALSVVNLDSFSLMGEFSGVAGSNRARVEIAARLRETARRDAVLAHVSDSEFVIADLFESNDASALVERVRGTISGSPSHLSASIGVVTTALQPLVALPPHEVLDELMSIATNAMYESRKGGGNQVTYVRSPALTVLDDPGNDDWLGNGEPA
jgi:diguanylate cyclase (GGDEF)-like protein